MLRIVLIFVASVYTLIGIAALVTSAISLNAGLLWWWALTRKRDPQ